MRISKRTSPWPGILTCGSSPAFASSQTVQRMLHVARPVHQGRGSQW